MRRPQPLTRIANNRLSLELASSLSLLLLSACASPLPASPASPMAFPPTGEFVDDYGIRYTIGPYAWTQHTSSPHANATVHVTDWNADRQFAIAQNDADNATDAGLWTRIDWVRLDGTDGYTWAYCYAVYDAATRNDAVTAPPSGRKTPRTGCNGFPFSRMKRVNTE
ncbi:MAG: hypothetical protein Rubg2KO_07390 [Rubricoccaceae bacterium]